MYSQRRDEARGFAEFQEERQADHHYTTTAGGGKSALDVMSRAELWTGWVSGDVVASFPFASDWLDDRSQVTCSLQASVSPSGKQGYSVLLVLMA